MFFIQFLLNLLIIKQTCDLIQFQFDKFIDNYEKPYKNDPNEYFKRIRMFENSLEWIQYLNRFRTHNDSAYYGITKYSDLSPEEFKETILKHKRNSDITKKKQKTKMQKRNAVKSSEHNEFEILNNVPKRFDWRNKNVVSHVHNQGKCGACWAYSTASTVESMVAIKTNKLREFSIQQLIDCSRDENQGCQGGDTCSTLIWMTKNNISLETAQDYPSREFSGECISDSSKDGVKIKTNHLCDNFVDNESKIIELIANHGPLIAAVDASTWQNYLGGIIQYHCFNDRNHAVQITGYDLTGSIPYYKIRNTWDENFGIDGYVHIAYGNNLCGIAEEISSIDVTDIPRSFFIN